MSNVIYGPGPGAGVSSTPGHWNVMMPTKDERTSARKRVDALWKFVIEHGNDTNFEDLAVKLKSIANDIVDRL